MVSRRRLILACSLTGAGALAGRVARGAGPLSPAAKLPTLDLLDLPAPTTAHGERKLLLDVPPGGPGLVAVGAFGLLLSSADGGRSWQQLPSPTAVMLTSVTFVDANHGWAVGHDGIIIATTDGGRRWTRQFDGRRANAAMLQAAQAESERTAALTKQDDATRQRQDRAADALSAAQAAVAAGPSQPFFAVRFTDAQRGYAAGAFGQLFATDDGGANWRYIGDRLGNPEGLHLNSISIGPSGSLYLAAEAGTVFISRDQGDSWTRASVGYDGHLYGALELATPDGGGALLAYGFKGHLFRSTDQGASWVRPVRLSQKTIVQGMARGATALLLSESGQLFTSHDGAGHFSAVLARLPLPRCAGFCLERDALVGVGTGGVALLPATALTTLESGT